MAESSQRRDVEGVAVDVRVEPSGTPAFPYLATGSYRLDGREQTSAVYGETAGEAVENLLTFVGRVIRFERGEGRQPPEGNQ